MRLLILRHAEAVPGADHDPDRPLTSRGTLQAQAMCRQLQDVLGDYRLLCSPWMRAHTTAAQLMSGEHEPSSSVSLIPSASLQAAAGLLESQFDDQSPLVVVTHQPLCGRLIHWLTEGRDQGLLIAPCSGALLELDWPAAGMARLVRWLDANPT
ncbi:histidine phosphatase family protein [Marinobacterium maritimum]|uniref:Histidine phosphatase family protein n=1 Tax=Marinobacterium maritimum TaxID=500162 RepID=A0ABP3TD96_9GAMM